MRRAVVVLCALATAARAQPVPDRVERVVGAARVWAKAKFFHPYLAYKDIDWDAAFVKALPKVEAATTLAQYKAAIGDMLAVLGDPVTRIADPAGSSVAKAASTDTAATWPAPDVMLIDLDAFVAGGFDYVGFTKRGAEIEKAAAKAKTLVVDLRATEPAWVTAAALPYFEGALPAVEQWPVQRVLEHRGWRTQDGSSTGGYFTTFLTTGAKPSGTPKPTGPQYVVFVADAKSPLPVEAIALQATGRASIVSSGALDPAGTVDTVEVALPGDFTANVRLGELLWGPPVADAVAKDPRAKALELARTAAPRPRTPKQADLPPLRVRDDADYADQSYPSRELRVLAAVRIWATLDRFFPYRYLITDWDGAFRALLPRIEAAADRTQYINALRELAVRAGDGHIGIAARTADPTIKPRGTIGAVLRLVEKHVTITRVVDGETAKLLSPGDVIEAVDGKPVAAAIAEKRAITSGSTEEARDQRIAGNLGYGDEGTPAKLTVRDARGKLREVVAPRTAAYLKSTFDPEDQPHWKKLPNNVGYVNLMLLMRPEVPKMLDALAATRAIIFDLRGYPNGVFSTLAPRLNVKHAKPAAQFLMPLVTGAGGDERIRFVQEIAEAPKDVPIYKGKIVVLIDDRAISQAEHTCLHLAEAATVTFVGSPTHGADGDITALRLPGGLRMWFTGQEVRWADGKQLQKIGVQPQIVVRPTLRGIRAGKDEVLDRARAFLESGK